MNLTCNKCQHSWEEDVAPGTPIVQCPECMVIVPTTVASQGGGATKTAIPKPAAPRPSSARPTSSRSAPRPDIGEKTVISGAGEKTIIESRPEQTSKTVVGGLSGQFNKTVITPSAGGVSPAGRGFTCNKCGHTWHEDAESSKPMVQCPECMAVMPLTLARKPGGAVSPPRARPAAGGSPETDKTMPFAPRPSTARPAASGSPESDRTLPPTARASSMGGTGSPAAGRPPRPAAKAEPAFDETNTYVPPKTPMAERPSRPAERPGSGTSARQRTEIPERPGSGTNVRPRPTGPPPERPGSGTSARARGENPPPRADETRTMPPRRSGVPGDETRTMPPRRSGAPSPDETRTMPPRPGRPGASRPSANLDEDVSDLITYLPQDKSSAPPPPEFDSDAPLPDPTHKTGFSNMRTVTPSPSRAGVRASGVARSARADDAEDAPPPPWMNKVGEDRPSQMATSPADGSPLGAAAKVIGGYALIKKLGEGGMGQVFLARQLSLDRNVAFKTLATRMAGNPEFLMRFTREALSAAQLNHHNIVQVHDVGSEKAVHFISMEFVQGRNLGDVVKEEGKLDPETASGFILQAARGLKFAHERGIVHRDIKPDNLMINDQGLIKIADMGLAKMRDQEEQTTLAGVGTAAGRSMLKKAKGDLTMHDIAMGTPAYMPPEQARDAGSVDHRADQYSLGCTFYYLLAGKTPFSGGSAMEIISKHMADPLPPLDQHVRGVPPSIKAIIERMTQKEPDDRYPSMLDVIRDLEAYLGLEGDKGVYSPKEKDAEQLDMEQHIYYGAKAARLRKYTVRGYFAFMTLTLLALIVMKQFLYAGAVVGLIALTPLADFLIGGMMNKTFLFRRARGIFFKMPLTGWAWTIGSTLILGGLFWIFRPVSYYWAGFFLLAAVFSSIYQKVVTKKLKTERSEPLDKIQEMLKRLRLKGVSEDALQDFIYRYLGEDWEELFEELFGYGPMMLARHKWASLDQVKLRRRFAVWRDPIFRWLDQIEEDRKRSKDKKELERIESDRLKAKGMSERLAKEKAKETAKQIVSEAKLTPTMTFRPEGVKDDGKSIIIKSEVAKRPGLFLSLDNPAFFYLFQLLQFIRLGAGGGLVALWALQRFNIFTVPLPSFLASASTFLGEVYAPIAGAMVFLSAFSKGKIMPNIVMLGALMLMFLEPVVKWVNQEQFTSTIGFYAAFGAMGVGLFLCFVDKMTGGDY